MTTIPGTDPHQDNSHNTPPGPLHVQWGVVRIQDKTYFNISPPPKKKGGGERQEDNEQKAEREIEQSGEIERKKLEIDRKVYKETKDEPKQKMWSLEKRCRQKDKKRQKDKERDEKTMKETQR